MVSSPFGQSDIFRWKLASGGTAAFAFFYQRSGRCKFSNDYLPINKPQEFYLLNGIIKIIHSILSQCHFLNRKQYGRTGSIRQQQTKWQNKNKRIEREQTLIECNKIKIPCGSKTWTLFRSALIGGFRWNSFAPWVCHLDGTSINFLPSFESINQTPISQTCPLFPDFLHGLHFALN